MVTKLQYRLVAIKPVIYYTQYSTIKQPGDVFSTIAAVVVTSVVIGLLLVVVAVVVDITVTLQYTGNKA